MEHRCNWTVTDGLKRCWQKRWWHGMSIEWIYNRTDGWTECKDWSFDSPSNKKVSSDPRNKLIKLNDGIIDAQTRSSWSREAAIVPTWTTTISRGREMEDGKERWESEEERSATLSSTAPRYGLGEEEKLRRCEWKKGGTLRRRKRGEGRTTGRKREERRKIEREEGRKEERGEENLLQVSISFPDLRSTSQTRTQREHGSRKKEESSGVSYAGREMEWEDGRGRTGKFSSSLTEKQDSGKEGYGEEERVSDEKAAASALFFLSTFFTKILSIPSQTLSFFLRFTGFCIISISLKTSSSTLPLVDSISLSLSLSFLLLTWSFCSRGRKEGSRTNWGLEERKEL